MLKHRKKGLLGLALASVVSPAIAEYGLNMTRGVTSFSEQAYDLHMIVLWVCVVIGIFVFGVMTYSMIYHRKSKGAVAATFSHSTKAEIVWTIVPIVILVALAIPATRTLIFMEASPEAEMTVKITGYQWKWRYQYIEEEFGFLSSLDSKANIVRQVGSGIDPNTVEHYLREVDNPLVLPVDTKIRFLITADDVIHSWWVPDFGWKRDAIPGFVNEAWVEISETGTYRGQCAELCGMDHGFMPIVAIVKSKEDYAAWVAEQKALARVDKPEATPLLSQASEIRAATEG